MERKSTLQIEKNNAFELFKTPQMKVIIIIRKETTIQRFNKNKIYFQMCIVTKKQNIELIS